MRTLEKPLKKFYTPFSTTKRQNNRKTSSSCEGDDTEKRLRRFKKREALILVWKSAREIPNFVSRCVASFLALGTSWDSDVRQPRPKGNPEPILIDMRMIQSQESGMIWLAVKSVRRSKLALGSATAFIVQRRSMLSALGRAECAGLARISIHVTTRPLSLITRPPDGICT